MNYQLKYDLPHNAATCVEDLLHARGIEDIDEYINPSAASELSPYLLDNIDEAAKLLMKHLERNSKMLILVDK